MKAIRFDEYGGPEKLTWADEPMPVPADDEVLIKVRATSINPYDWHHLRGMLPIRFLMGFKYPKKNNILGADVAGIVEQVGKDVEGIEVGQEVYGSCRYGGFAEYATAHPKNLAAKPPNLSFEEAASIPMVGYTGIQGLKHFGMPQPNQRILINGASGGIGTITVQLAKYYGAHVTAVSSSAKVDLVESLGADEVIDYEKTELSGKYDLIIDNVGNLSLSKMKSMLAPGGHVAVNGFTNFKLLLSTIFFGGKRIKTITAEALKEDLEFIGWLLRDEKIKPVIDTVYPLKDARLGMEKIATRHIRGKIVLSNN